MFGSISPSRARIRHTAQTRVFSLVGWGGADDSPSGGYEECSYRTGLGTYDRFASDLSSRPPSKKNLALNRIRDPMRRKTYSDGSAAVTSSVLHVCVYIWDEKSSITVRKKLVPQYFSDVLFPGGKTMGIISFYMYSRWIYIIIYNCASKQLIIRGHSDHRYLSNGK